MRTPHSKTLKFAAGLIAVAVLLLLPALCAEPGHALEALGYTIGFGALGMAVTANQLITRAEGEKTSYPAAAARLYQGTLAFVNASGYLDDDTASGVNNFAGVVVADVDNSGGSAGDLNCEVWRDGEFILTGSSFTQATVGVPIYATDNYTVGTDRTATGAVYIGVCTEYRSTTKIVVRLDPHAVEAETSDSWTGNVITFNGATGVPEIRVTTNLADALSMESTAGDIFVLDTTTGAVVFNFSADVRVNILGSAQIGNATTDLVAFHGSTPTDQCAAYTQTYSTAARTVPAEVAAISGGESPTEAEHNLVVADLLALKKLINALIDDLQEKGLVG